ncbi:MAG: hypothetical protein ACHQUC_05755 [Chlamydiales bacterium]
MNTDYRLLARSPNHQGSVGGIPTTEENPTNIPAELFFRLLHSLPSASSNQDLRLNQWVETLQTSAFWRARFFRTYISSAPNTTSHLCLDRQGEKHLDWNRICTTLYSWTEERSLIKRIPLLHELENFKFLEFIDSQRVLILEQSFLKSLNLLTREVKALFSFPATTYEKKGDHLTTLSLDKKFIGVWNRQTERTISISLDRGPKVIFRSGSDFINARINQNDPKEVTDGCITIQNRMINITAEDSAEGIKYQPIVYEIIHDGDQPKQVLVAYSPPLVKLFHLTDTDEVGVSLPSTSSPQPIERLPISLPISHECFITYLNLQSGKVIIGYNSNSGWKGELEIYDVRTMKLVKTISEISHFQLDGDYLVYTVSNQLICKINLRSMEEQTVLDRFNYNEPNYFPYPYTKYGPDILKYQLVGGNLWVLNMEGNLQLNSWKVWKVDHPLKAKSVASISGISLGGFPQCRDFRVINHLVCLRFDDAYHFFKISEDHKLSFPYILSCRRNVEVQMHLSNQYLSLISDLKIFHIHLESLKTTEQILPGADGIASGTRKLLALKLLNHFIMYITSEDKGSYGIYESSSGESQVEKRRKVKVFFHQKEGHQYAERPAFQFVLPERLVSENASLKGIIEMNQHVYIAFGNLIFDCNLVDRSMQIYSVDGSLEDIAGDHDHLLLFGEMDRLREFTPIFDWDQIDVTKRTINKNCIGFIDPQRYPNPIQIFSKISPDSTSFYHQRFLLSCDYKRGVMFIHDINQVEAEPKCIKISSIIAPRWPSRVRPTADPITSVIEGEIDPKKFDFQAFGNENLLLISARDILPTWINLESGTVHQFSHHEVVFDYRKISPNNYLIVFQNGTIILYNADDKSEDLIYKTETLLAKPVQFQLNNTEIAIVYQIDFNRGRIENAHGHRQSDHLIQSVSQYENVLYCINLKSKLSQSFSTPSGWNRSPRIELLEEANKLIMHYYQDPFFRLLNTEETSPFENAFLTEIVDPTNSSNTVRLHDESPFGQIVHVTPFYLIYVGGPEEDYDEGFWPANQKLMVYRFGDPIPEPIGRTHINESKNIAVVEKQLFDQQLFLWEQKYRMKPTEEYDGEETIVLSTTLLQFKPEEGSFEAPANGFYRNEENGLLVNNGNSFLFDLSTFEIKRWISSQEVDPRTEIRFLLYQYRENHLIAVVRNACQSEKVEVPSSSYAYDSDGDESPCYNERMMKYSELKLFDTAGTLCREFTIPSNESEILGVHICLGTLFILLTEFRSISLCLCRNPVNDVEIYQFEQVLSLPLEGNISVHCKFIENKLFFLKNHELYLVELTQTLPQGDYTAVQISGHCKSFELFDKYLVVCTTQESTHLFELSSAFPTGESFPVVKGRSSECPPLIFPSRVTRVNLRETPYPPARRVVVPDGSL